MVRNDFVMKLAETGDEIALGESLEKLLEDFIGSSIEEEGPYVVIELDGHREMRILRGGSFEEMKKRIEEKAGLA